MKQESSPNTLSNQAAFSSFEHIKRDVRKGGSHRFTKSKRRESSRICGCVLIHESWTATMTFKMQNQTSCNSIQCLTRERAERQKCNTVYTHTLITTWKQKSRFSSLATELFGRKTYKHECKSGGGHMGGWVSRRVFTYKTLMMRRRTTHKIQVQIHTR